MINIKKSLFYRFLLGYGLGIIIGGVIFLISKGMNSPVEKLKTWDMIRGMLCCGLYGAASLCGMILYKLDSVSLVIATAIHFFIVMAGLFLLGLSLGWKFDTALVRYIFAAYLLIFILCWVTMYLVGKRRVRKMNRDLQQWKSMKQKPT